MNNLLHQALRIRRIEEALAIAYVDQEIRCPMHLDIGGEFVAVGVCSNLKVTDKVFSGHRAHAQYLAKGGCLNKFFAELCGKQEGCCNGYGGSMHLQAPEVGFVASTAIVGGTIPLAVGSAWADKLQGKDNVTVVFFGDGAVEEGVFGESLNFAALHELPIVFVCSNNGLAVTTDISERKSNKFDTGDVVEGYGVEYTLETWGWDIDFITGPAKRAIEQARKDKPQFLEFYTERQRVHCGIEHEYELTNDPLEDYKIDETEIQREIEEAFEFARQSPIPTNVRDVYSA